MKMTTRERAGTTLPLHLGALVCIALCGCGGAPEPTLDVDAEQLVDDYKKNEIGAVERYEGKVVRIKGEVNSIDKGLLGGLSITLDGSFMWGADVVCEFDKSHAAALAKLRTGDDVAVIGRVEGRFMNSGGDVKVEDCRLE
jgi:hypothetical protein